MKINKTKKLAGQKSSRYWNIPAVWVLGLIILGCILADVIAPKNASYMDMINTLRTPCGEFLFGTDTLGRDIWSGVWHGGRLSIAIGLVSTLISTFIAVVYGAISGMASDTVDTIMMRAAEIVLSIPGLLLVVSVQAMLGKPNPASIAIVIGVTGWPSIAKVVRMEVRQLRNSEFILVSKAMGGSFGYILRRHLLPNFVPSIMFMVIMNIRGAIASESTLSFMGLGLPIESVSWGSMLSLSQNALTSGAWWVALIPGLVLVIFLMALTDIGNRYRAASSHRESNL